MPTAADSQGLNRYAYCHSNPLNSADPSGQLDLVTVAIIIIVVAGVVNVAVAMATGGDIGKAALTGLAAAGARSARIAGPHITLG